MEKKLKQAVKEVIGIVIFLMIIFFFYKCPMKLIFGIDCPGCGMTRACKAFLRLDFVAAFQYHSLFPIPILVCIYLIFRKKLFIGEKNERISIGVILLLFILRWIIILF